MTSDYRSLPTASLLQRFYRGGYRSLEESLESQPEGVTRGEYLRLGATR